MTFGNKYGRKSVTWKVNTKDRTYYKLDELWNKYPANHTYIIDCLFINDKSQYDPAPVCGVADASGSYMVNLPKHLLNEAKQMLADQEAIEDIQLGRAGFKIRQYLNTKYKKACFTVDWCDVELPNDLPF